MQGAQRSAPKDMSCCSRSPAQKIHDSTVMCMRRLVIYDQGERSREILWFKSVVVLHGA